MMQTTVSDVLILIFKAISLIIPC